MAGKGILRPIQGCKSRDAPLPGRQRFFGCSVGTGAGPSVSMPRRCSGRPAQVVARPTAQGDELRRFVGLTSQVLPSLRAGWRRAKGLDGTIGGLRAGRRLRRGRGFVRCIVPEGIIGRPGWLLMWKVGGPWRAGVHGAPCLGTKLGRRGSSRSGSPRHWSPCLGGGFVVGLRSGHGLRAGWTLGGCEALEVGCVSAVGRGVRRSFRVWWVGDLRGFEGTEIAGASARPPRLLDAKRLGGATGSRVSAGKARGEPPGIRCRPRVLTRNGDCRFRQSLIRRAV